MKTSSKQQAGRPASPPHTQNGAVALVAALFLLIAAVLVTLFTASPVRTEQQMTANERRSFQALNAAEAGLAYIHGFIRNYDATIDPCELKEVQTGSFQIVSMGGVTCSTWPYWSILQSGATNVAAVGYISVPVVVEGRSDDGIGMRRIRETVYLLDFGEGGGATMAPLNLAGNVTIFDAAESGVFEINGTDEDGNEGPAIATQGQTNADFVESQIREGNLANYVGGFSGGGFGEPFDNANDLNTFVQTIKADGGTTIHGTGDDAVGGNDAISGVHVYEGNLELSGTPSANPERGGVLIVEGNLTLNGTPSFNGLIIVLGGTLDTSGGGNGGLLGGAVFVGDLNCSGSCVYGDTVVDFRGGGTAEYQYRYDRLREAWDQLAADAQALWEPVQRQSSDDPALYGAGLRSGPIVGSWADF